MSLVAVFLIKGSILEYWPSMETFSVILEEVLHHNVTLEEIIPTLKEKWVGQWLVEAWAYPSAISLRSPLLCVNSWIEARSERSDDITVSWTFWTLVVRKAKTPIIFRSFPMTRTASHPHKSILFLQDKTSCPASCGKGTALAKIICT